jgi:hypothetical protein
VLIVSAVEGDKHMSPLVLTILSIAVISILLVLLFFARG